MAKEENSWPRGRGFDSPPNVIVWIGSGQLNKSIVPENKFRTIGAFLSVADFVVVVDDISVLVIVVVVVVEFFRFFKFTVGMLGWE